MKKRYLPFLFIIPAAFLFIQKPEVVLKEKVSDAPVIQKALPLTPVEASVSREPAKEETDRAPAELVLEKKPDRNHREWEAVLDLGRGLKIIKDVYAVKTESYSTTLGDAVSESFGYTMVNTANRPDGGSPVAYDQANGRYFAVSSIIKIQNVSSELRDDLLQSGLSEYYYAGNINVLYVESGPDKVVDLYRELKKQNLEAELEVIKPARRPR